uniref:Membrane anchored junction protein n=1 Tax=Chinchilla lanigera TaxID=34839 RepID=A0A8C2W2Q9_CHILA
MSLKPFTYPFPETRFLHAGPSVYKFKIRYGHILGNLDNLQPFVTEHFIVFPYKSKWERVSHLKFKHEDVVLIPYPFVFTLYVEMKWFHENLSPESGSSLKVVAEKKAAGGAMKKRKLLEEHSSPQEAGLPRSESTSRRIPFSYLSVFLTDSKWGHNLPGAIVPPLQQNNSPPPKELGLRGFFGFLSTLFPLRYFFKKSSQ